MEFSPGHRFGPYEILAPLGAGGMGEVYRARDTRLGREVAVKTLPGSAAARPEALARFEREGRALSQLHHARICAVFDVGSQDGVPYLVMELLEGETLAVRLARGPLTTRETLQVAIQVAEGLEAAHRAGLVHRDLKSANVMLTRGGAKLLDFGLARASDAFAPDAADPAGGLSLTRSADVTAEGMIVGTLRNMAPEQLDGGPVDARTDLFAFGGLVHEMASGRPPFEAKSRASLVAAILKESPPPLDALAPGTSPELARVVARCLAKDPEDRWQNTRDLLHQLRWIQESATSGAASVAPASGVSSSSAASVAPPRRPAARFARLVREIVTAVLVAGVTYAIVDRVRDRQEAERAVPWRFEIPLTEERGNPYGMAFSPDGRTLVYVVGASGAGSLWLRPPDAAVSRRIPGTEGARFPFWSPDGRSIAFFADGKLKRIDLDGEQVRVLCDAPEGRGGTWSAAGVILFTPGLDGAIYRVSASGGSPEQETRLDEANGARSHRWPWFLPDGERFVYLANSAPGGVDRLLLGAIGDSASTPLLEETSRAEYDGSGNLLYVRDGTLFSQAFDTRRGVFTGEPIAIETGVEASGAEGPTGYGAFAVSRWGGLAFARPFTSSTNQLIWMDRNGAPIDTLGPPSMYAEPAISPDGNSIAVNTHRAESEQDDLWLVDLRREVFSRFTFDSSSDVAACWSPDGRWIAYSSEMKGRANVYRKPADGSRDPEVIVAVAPEGDDVYWSDHWSADGRFLVLDATTSGTGARKFDLHLVAMDGTLPAPALPFLTSSFDETHGCVSPDSRWIAYTSNETGLAEIYVQSFPEPGSKLKISEHGGDQATWRADGRELYFLSLDRTLMAVDVVTGERFEAGRPRVLFEARTPEPDPDGPRTFYAAALDGQRFLLCITNEAQATASIHVRTNWRRSLEARSAGAP